VQSLPKMIKLKFAWSPNKDIFLLNFRPEVFWYRDGSRLIPEDEPPNRIHMGVIGRKHILTVANIGAERDSGTYTCHAINQIGEAKENFPVLTNGEFDDTI